VGHSRHWHGEFDGDDFDSGIAIGAHYCHGQRHIGKRERDMPNKKQWQKTAL
jgi:hypothetical protein